MIIRIWHTKVGTFMQCRVYVGSSPTKTMDKVGTLQVDVDKWDEFKETMDHAEFIEDFKQ